MAADRENGDFGGKKNLISAEWTKYLYNEDELKSCEVSLEKHGSGTVLIPMCHSPVKLHFLHVLGIFSQTPELKLDS